MVESDHRGRARGGRTSATRPAAAPVDQTPVGEHRRRWYRLDNTAKIFPPNVNDRYTSVFRISVTLRDPVVLTALRQAVEQTRARFPYFFVRLRRGAFWYYLEEDPAIDPVRRDTGSPCYPAPHVGMRPALIRLAVRHRRIALEVSHILTDGMGALTFLRALVGEYARATGSCDVAELVRQLDAAGIARSDLGPRFEETEDAYLREYHEHLPMPVEYPPAWHLSGARLPPAVYHLSALQYDAAQIVGLARQRQVTVTELLLGCFLYSLQLVYRALPRHEQWRRANRRPIRILVPVNLRPLVGTQTVRNFFVFLMVELDQRLGWYELDEVVQRVHNVLRVETDARNLRRQLRRNVRAELNPLIRILPIAIKDWILRVTHRVKGEHANTASFSTLGRVEWPPLLAERIEAMEFYPPPSVETGVNATVITCNDQLVVGFGSTLRGKAVERTFARVLGSLGALGALTTNYAMEPGAEVLQ